MTVTFSEVMSASTIGAATFELRDPANNLVAAAVSYNSTTRVATLNPTPTLAALTTYTVRVLGGAAGVKDATGNALAATVTWTFTTVTDTTAPTISARSPASGATGVSATANVVVTFNEDMAPATINTNTVQLTNPGGTLITAAVTYNTATRQATLDPSVTLSAFTVYTVTVRGGTTDPRVKDGAGNALASTTTWQFRTQ
jgi:methionine-rich copper-binding protein CopC